MRTGGGTDPTRSGKSRKKTIKAAPKSVKKPQTVPDHTVVQPEAGLNTDSQVTADNASGNFSANTACQQSKISLVLKNLLWNFFFGPSIFPLIQFSCFLV
jgi:hypothetical protein